MTEKPKEGIAQWWIRQARTKVSRILDAHQSNELSEKEAIDRIMKIFMDMW